MSIATKIICAFLTTLALVLLKDTDYPLRFPPEKYISKVPPAKEKWIWNTAFTIFSSTVILLNHNMLAIHLYLCIKLFL